MPLKEVESKLKELFEQGRHKKKIKLIQTHPGVGPVVAGMFRIEIFAAKIDWALLMNSQHRSAIGQRRQRFSYGKNGELLFDFWRTERVYSSINLTCLCIMI